MIKLLIVDDHELVRIGLERLLADAEDIEVVGDAASGLEAIEKAQTLNPDIILMDINMPGMSGIEATHKLLAQNPNAKIIIVTIFDAEAFSSSLLNIGASGYINKGSSISELLNAIRTVAAGLRYINPAIAESLSEVPNKDPIKESPLNALSERELEVLVMITKGMMVNEIAQKMESTIKTVNSYRYRLFEKLEVNNDVELTYLAIRYNLIKLNQIQAAIFTRRSDIQPE